MKKILVLEGSPREKGNTALVADWVLDGLGRGFEVERIRVADLDINGCRECGTCWKTKGEAGCAQEDAMIDIYDKVLDCDLLVFTSPIFCWSVSGQLKTATDRLLALMFGENMLKGKRLALILTAGGDHYDGADLVVRAYRNLARFGDMRYLGQHVVAPCPDRPALNRRAALHEEARRFGKELRKRLKA
jgi:multimeric flavodoxin WrbA